MTPTAVHAHNPGPFTGTGNTTWLLRGRVPTLIDAGAGDTRHVDDLVRSLGGDQLVRVLVTHGHSDHVAGAPVIAERIPGVRFGKMPWPAHDSRYPVSFEPIADNDRVQAGDTTLIAVHTPGHAPDHLCFWHEETRSMFCGDLAVQGTTVVIPASESGDLRQYLASLERVLALNPVTLYPAHGPVIDEPEALLRNYLAHRREREQQILAALAAGDTSPEGIVKRVYVRLLPALEPMARESVTSHLLKLEREGRIRRTAEGWTMI